jgi:dCMP deaminase
MSTGYNNRVSEEDYFFEIASVVSRRATCPRARIGAVLSKFGRIIGTGYNGAAPGEPHCLERDQTLEQHLALRHCEWALHAERNALRNAFIPADGATLYVVGPRPVCPNCRDYLASRGVTDIRHRYGVATLDTLAREIRAWQAATFPHATPVSVAEHLRREAEELAGEPSDPEEMADIFHLLVAAAEANGYDLVNVVATKFAVNLNRRWQAPDAAGVVEHVRSEATP